MEKPRLQKNEKNILANIEELTPENFEIIKDMFERGFTTSHIFNSLQENIKRDPRIVDLCIKYISPQTLKSTLGFLTKGINIDKIEFLKNASMYHPDLVAKYLKRNKIDVNSLSEIMEINPEIYEMLFSCDLYSREEKNNIYARSDKWMKDGEPIQYFKLAKNVKFRGREDYLKLIDLYIYEDDSTKKFCKKYRLDREKFNKILKIVSDEDKELSEQVKQVKERATQKYISLMKETVERVVKGETTIGELLKLANGRINGWDFINSKSFIDHDEYRELLFKMVEEINKGNKESKVDKFDKKYELPMIGRMNMDQLAKWFDNDKNQPVENVYQALGLIKGRLQYEQTNNEREKNLKILSDIFLDTAHEYGSDFSDEYKKQWVGHTHFLRPGTKEELYVTEKNVQDANAIIKANKKAPSKKLVKALVKDVLTGEITESEIIESYEKVKSEELKEKAKIEKREQRMEGLRTIDDYIKFINTPIQEQDKEKEGKQQSE